MNHRYRPYKMSGTQLLEWIFSNTVCDIETKCHLWLKSKTQGGYARIIFEGKQSVGHRLVYHLIHPESFSLDSPRLVLHECDVRACVNPAHLFLGSQRDNIADMFAKKRNPNQKGHYNNNAKLNEARVREILEKYIPRRYTIDRLAEEYGVNRATIHRIVTRQDWRHVV